MPLVYLPHRRLFLLFDEERLTPRLDAAMAQGQSAMDDVVVPGQTGLVKGLALPLLETVGALSSVPVAEVTLLPASLAAWSLASKLALDLVSRERVVPTIVREDGLVLARWGAALAAGEDAARVTALARSFPPSAHALRVQGHRRRDVWAPEAMLRAFLDATVDALVREVKDAPGIPSRRPSRSANRDGGDHGERWEARFREALVQDEEGRDILEVTGFEERNVPEEVASWSRPALGFRDQARACFRLDLPEDDGESFTLRFLLQSPDDPSLIVPAADVWRGRGRALGKFGAAFRDPQETLLEALGRAARLFEPIAACLGEARPASIALEPASAFSFLADGAPALAESGFGVIVPSELTAAGARRLRLRMKIGGGHSDPGRVDGGSTVGFDALISFEWEAALGDEKLSASMLQALARHKAPLVRHRGLWVVVDPEELARIQLRLGQRGGTVTGREAFKAALSGEIRDGLGRVEVEACGALAEAVKRLREGAAVEAAPPLTLDGTLRPYQLRGLSWLDTMSTLGLGACLADDMGLGKTIQLLAWLLRRMEESPADVRPSLLVAPTSVLGNWEREAERFAPSLFIVRHYGPDRPREAGDIPQAPGVLVVTSYGLLRRDAAMLSEVRWAAVALDEAQNIKNSASATARTACSLDAAHRFALTGTPVENRLTELWSIFQFCNPGLLGSLEAFRTEYAVPIERFGNDQVAERLRRIASPFLLRRVKTDRSIIQDLPGKNEMKVICTLTREQASLYQAVVNEELERIESAEDVMKRRGRVLALLSFLKQICNHPAHYLGEAAPLHRRSGKLDRITEMLEEALSEGDKALVFTQFREMGNLLLRHLGDRLGVEVVFLHGGTPRKARDDMVRRFQEDPRGPRIFLLSVKAGGTGLNLTAATHVFHFDRWWNPAVEDQATDRAYRIGQKRSVQVHKLVCAGTVEEKVDLMLERKRDLASKVVGTGESWITEMGNEDLRELFALAGGSAVDGDGDMDDERPARRRKAKPRGPRRAAGAEA